MNKKLLKFSLAFMTGAAVLVFTTGSALAYEELVAGFTYDKVNNETAESKDTSTVSTMSATGVTIPGFNKLGIADVNTNLLIRKTPNDDGKILGKIPRHGGVEIIEEDNGTGWTKVSSGKLSGYVKSDYLVTGSEAARMALQVGNHIAKANVDGLRVRKSASVDADILDSIAKGEELIVIDELVVTYGAEYNKWVKVSLDSDDSEDGIVGYVAKQYVDLSYALKKAISMEELEYGTPGVSKVRMEMINYAKRFIGNPYVWGGSSLSNGVDCSGFTQKIYAKFNYYIDRVSRDQARGGKKISKSELKPGDLVFYGNSSSGYINHVAIYMGNDRVIHASNKRDGIKTSNLYYRTPLKYVRYIKD